MREVLDARPDVGALARRQFLRAAGRAGAIFALAGLATSACSELKSNNEQIQLALPEASDEIKPFALRVPEPFLADLRRRLASVRWPEAETAGDGAQGPPLERVRELIAYWSTEYDWRRAEAKLNDFGQYRTRLDGLGIHFLHVRSIHGNAMPILLTHGWPGSVVEFLNVIAPLVDPTTYGGSAEDAFHVVVPSLPGFGFSDKPRSAGWNGDRIAKSWAELMNRLGYARYIAQGGDWGADVTSRLARLRPPNLAGIHLNFIGTIKPPVVGEPSTEERASLDKLDKFTANGSGYYAEQATRPQQVGYGLADSPAGQAAWIYEKFLDWTDTAAKPEAVLGYDRMLDNIMLYWVPSTAASSARIYWENRKLGEMPSKFDVPVGFSDFPGEIVSMPRVWAERIYGKNLIYFNRVERGGHFAAFEQPNLFVREMREFARLLR
jgi:epoxide hydrolase